MSADFYNVEKCSEEIRDMINNLSSQFSYDTILCAMERVMNEG
jgi:hypothetical protein